MQSAGTVVHFVLEKQLQRGPPRRKRKIMMKNIGGRIAGLALLAASATLAHGGQEHVMGTVVSADAKSVVVKTAKGVQTTIQLDDKTKVERDGKEAKAGNLRAGERVVVHAHKGESGLTATVIKAGAAKAHAH